MKLNAKSPSGPNTLDLIELHDSLAQRFRVLDIRMFTAPRLVLQPHFEKKSSSELCHIKNVLTEMHDSLNEFALPASKFSTEQFVWRALKKYQMHIDRTRFNREIRSDEIVEIFTPAGTVLRSLNFFNFCSFLLNDYCERSWDEMWERPIDLIRFIEGLLDQCWSGEYFINLGRKIHHHVQEVDSPLSYKCSYQLNDLIPLYSTASPSLKKPIGIMTVIQAELLTKMSREEEEELYLDYCVRKFGRVARLHAVEC